MHHDTEHGLRALRDELRAEERALHVEADGHRWLAPNARDFPTWSAFGAAQSEHEAVATNLDAQLVEATDALLALDDVASATEWRALTGTEQRRLDALVQRASARSSSPRARFVTDLLDLGDKAEQRNPFTAYVLDGLERVARPRRTKQDKREARAVEREQERERELRHARRALEAMGTLPRTYDHYVVVLTANEAILVANVLARLGLALDGLTLRVDEPEDEALFTVGPRDIREAHAVVLDALHERWLGAND